MHLYFFSSYTRSKKSGAFIFYNILLFVFGSFFSAGAQSPTITSFSPTTTCQGELVTITGTNFTGATAVKLGSAGGTNISVISATTITANIAANASSGTVTVTTPGGIVTATGTLTIFQTPVPALADVSTKDGPFTNCDGNATYQLKVNNISTNISGTNSYQIDWGDNTPPFTMSNWLPNGQTTHTYTSQGYFNIVFTITSANNCKNSTTYNFYNGKNPLASLTTTNSTTGLCAPAPVEFQVGNWFNNSAGTSYQLDFGDGTPRVTLQHPLNTTNTIQLISHTYDTSSCPSSVDFTAKLNAINGCFTTSYTLNQIIIRKKPEPNFTTLPSPACINSPVCFTNTSKDGFSGNSCNTTSTYLWDFGDGTTSTDKIPPCHTYPTAGSYEVTLTASNTSCGSGMIKKTITVTSPSPVPVIAVNPVNYCRGQAATPIIATGTGLLWYTVPTGGTGNPVAPTPPTNTVGTITWYVSQTVPGSCESPRVAVTVTVNALPAAPGVTTPVQLCQNQPANPLTATGSNLLWYTTATGGTGSSTAPTPSTTSTGNTTYYVSQTTTNCEGTRASIVIIVNSVAAAPGVTSPVIYCQNQAAIPLKATGTGLLWYTDATGGTGSNTAPTPLTNIVGSTTYYVSQVTGCGEGPRSSITVNVNASPAASIAYGSNNLCNITDNASNSNPPVPVTLTGDGGGSYSITPSSGLLINSANGTLTPSGATAGTYTIKYTIPGSGPCGNFTTTTTVMVSGSPTATISYPSICTSDAATNVTIAGSKNGVYTSTVGLTIDQSTGAITPATSAPGTYTVTYTIAASAPCPRFVTTAIVTVSKAPSASISYSGNTLCNVTDNASTPNPPVNVILTGTPGGTYSILPATGLTINSANGMLTPSGAAAGNYTVRYIVSGSGGCANYSTTSNIVVSGSPAAVINYSGSPYCRGVNNPQQVSSSGTKGGVFSAGAGLSINTTTGDINPSLSTPGVYTVTYTIAASSPCPGYVTTAKVEIIDSPVLTFATPSESICSGGAAAFIPSSTVANTSYSWSVVGQLPTGVSGVSSGTASGANPVISLSFTNKGTTSQVINVQVIPANPLQSSCTGTPYNLSLTVNPVPDAPVTDVYNFCMKTISSPLKEMLPRAIRSNGMIIIWCL